MSKGQQGNNEVGRLKAVHEPDPPGLPARPAPSVSNPLRRKQLQANPMSAVTPGFAMRSRFVIANGMVEQVREAFRNRPHAVDSAPGFLRMEVLSPAYRSEEIWLMTYWTDRESYCEWHGSHLYRESHAGIPKGLKLIGAETEIRHLDFICA